MALKIWGVSSERLTGHAETEQMHNKQEKPKEYSWVDEVFRLQEERWGTWVSYDRQGNKIVSSLTEDTCLSATRFYLKGKQEGFPETEGSYDSFVGGKL